MPRALKAPAIPDCDLLLALRTFQRIHEWAEEKRAEKRKASLGLAGGGGTAATFSPAVTVGRRLNEVKPRGESALEASEDGEIGATRLVRKPKATARRRLQASAEEKRHA